MKEEQEEEGEGRKSLVLQERLFRSASLVGRIEIWIAIGTKTLYTHANANANML